MLEKEVVKFFQDRKEYERILTAIFEKYKSIGKLSGTFELKELNDEERRILASIHHKYFAAKEAKVSVKKFLDYFCSGRFEGLDFTKVLAIYFKDNLTTYREEKECKKIKKEEFFKELININKGTKSELWLQKALENKGFGYNILIKNYEAYSKNNKLKDFKLLLSAVLNGINSLTFSDSALESLPIIIR